MKAAILVSAAVSSLVSIIGTLVALNVLAPAAVEAQQAGIRDERVAVVDGNGTERAIMSTGPGARSAVGVWSATGIPRAVMSTGGVPPGGTEPDEASLGVFAPEGSTAQVGGLPPIASLGTGAGGAGSALVLRDRQGQTRIWLRVDADGNPSMEMRDASGNVTWRAQ